MERREDMESHVHEKEENREGENDRADAIKSNKGNRREETNIGK
jgi:hypothetical protein